MQKEDFEKVNSGRPSRKRIPTLKLKEQQQQDEQRKKKKKPSYSNEEEPNPISFFICPICNVKIDGINDGDILKNHFELPENERCKELGLYHCRPPCSKYFLRSEQRENHLRQKFDCQDRHAKFLQDMELAQTKAHIAKNPTPNYLQQQNNYSFRNLDLAKNRILRTKSHHNVHVPQQPSIHSDITTDQIAQIEFSNDQQSYTNMDHEQQDVEDHTQAYNSTRGNDRNICSNTVDSKSLIRLQEAIREQSDNTIIPPELKCFIHLEEILRNINAPTECYNKIIKWAKSNANILSSERLDEVSTDTLYQIMQSNIFCDETSKLMMPKTEQLILPSHQVVNLSYFEIIPAIVELLTKPVLTKYQSLIFSEFMDHPKNINKNPFFIPLYDSEYCSETVSHLITAKWYAEVYSKKISDPSSELLVPLLIYIDATAVTNSGSTSMEVISLSLGIFKREIRDSSSAWKTLGYIPSMLSKILENNNQSPQEKAEDYHFILDKFMTRIQQVVSETSFEWFLSDDKSTLVKKLLKFEVIFMMGDTKGQDILCGRYASHLTKGIGRLCTCSTEDSDNPFVDCIFLSKEFMNSKNEMELNNASFRLLKNHAFKNFSFGIEKFGIYTSTPPDTLHCFMLGICDRLYTSFLDNLTHKMYIELNYNVARIAIFHNRQAEQNLYPDIRKFKDGILLRGIITAKQRLSRIFILFLVLLSSDFNKVLFNKKGKCPKKSKTKKKTANKDNNGFESQIEENDQNDEIELSVDETFNENDQIDTNNDNKSSESILFDNPTITNWILAFEKTLIFYAFLSAHEIDIRLLQESQNNKSIATVCCENFLLHLIRTLNREEGYGLKLFKIHVHKHWSYYMENYGAAWNYDTARNESFHVKETKALAKRTRRLAATIDERTCVGQYRRLLLQKNLEKIHVQNLNPKKTSEYKKFGRQIQIDFSYGENSLEIKDCTVTWSNIKKSSDEKTIQLDEYIINELKAHLQMYKDLQIMRLICYSNINLSISENDSEMICFRAHPNLYDDLWYDWVLIRWLIDGKEIYYPAKLLLIIDFDRVVISKKPQNGTIKHGIWLLVRSTEKLCTSNDQDPYKHSLLSHRYSMETGTQLVPVDTVVNSAFVVDASSDSSDSIIYIEHPFQWIDYFESSLKTDNINDGLREKLKNKEFKSIFE